LDRSGAELIPSLTERPRMTLNSMASRSQLADKVAGAKDSGANAVSDELFLKHPEWLERYGERGRQRCKEDIRFHIQFLAGAIEAGSPEAFADYARWTSRLLGARGMTSDSLREAFHYLGKHFRQRLALSEEEAALVSSFLDCDWEAAGDSAMAAEEAGVKEGLRLTREVFLSAILAGERRVAVKVIEQALREGQALIDIYLDVFAAALHRVGKLWEANKITVAQEHLATAITQYAIAAVYLRISSTGPRRGRMIVTGVAGEMHQIGANLVADAMETQGWEVSFLGANVPSAAIVDAVEEKTCDVLCISTTLVANLPTVAELIGLVRARLKEKAPRIVVGGGAYRLTANFAEEMGVEGSTNDLRTTVAMLCG
jgi:methanogenic corrinoid protein MtbC1